MINTVFDSKGVGAPTRIALIYAIFGLLWVAFSDALLMRIVSNIDTMATIGIYKGWFFIILTSGIVFFLVKQQDRREQQVEEKLRESEQRFKNTSKELKIILDHIPALIIYKNDKNVILRVNQAAADAIGTTPEAMAGEPTERFYPEYAEKYYQDDLEIISTGQPKLGIVEQTPTPNGETRWIESNKIPIRIQDERVSEILIIASDITKHKQSQEALEKQRALLEAIFNDIPDALMISDLNRRFIMTNPGTTQVFGYQPDELLSKSTDTIYADAIDYTRQGQLRFNPEADEILKPYIINYRRKNGEIFPGESIGTVINGADGKPSGYLGLIRDISDRIEAEQEARELHERLAHVGRVGLMGEMAAGIAHEINQPLTAIANYAQACRRLLDSNPTSPKITVTLEKISNQALRAGEIIHKLRSLTKRGESKRESVDSNALIREVIKLAEIETRANKVLILLELEADLPTVLVDSVQIQQVILNLVRNGMEASIATQYLTPEIRIRSWLDNGDHITIAVEDNGTGVSEEAIQKIFSPFFTTKSSGLGMGLSICHTIIKSHDGELNFKANPEGGSIFYFTLPIIGE